MLYIFYQSVNDIISECFERGHGYWAKPDRSRFRAKLSIYFLILALYVWRSKKKKSAKIVTYEC